MGLGKTYSTKYLADSNNNTGVAGQVLSTTSTGIDWADANTLPGAGLWLESGNNIYNSNSGNVGIGTTSPVTKLMLEHYNDGAVGGTIRIKDRDSQQAANQLTGAIEFESQDATIPTSGVSTAIKAFSASSTGGSYLTISTTDISTSTLDERMRITSGGNVGIGTTSPTSTLQVDGQVLISATAPFLDFVDTNSFTDVNDRFRVRAGGNEGLIQWYDDSASSLLSIMTFQPNGDVIVPNGAFYAEGSLPTTPGMSGTGIGLGQASNYAHAQFSGSAGGYIDFSEPNVDWSGRIIYTHSSDSMVFYTATTAVLTLDSSSNATFTGNVGIGTTSPGYKLEVNAGNGIFVGDGGAAVLSANSTTGIFTIGDTDQLGDGVYATNTSTSSFDIYSGGSIKFRMDVNGNVGIGVTSPGAKLEIYGTSITRTHFNEGLRVTRETVPAQFGMFNYNGGSLNMIAVNTAGTGSVTKFMRSGNGTSLDTSMVIDTNGNVGIGTTSPDAKLDIQLASSTSALVSADEGLRLSTSTVSTSNTTHKSSPFLKLFGGIWNGTVNSSRGFTFQSVGISGTNYGYRLAIGTLDTPDIMSIIGNGGNVGIGTTSPVQKLHIVDTDGANIILNSNTGAENNGIWMTEGGVANPYANGAYVHYDSTNNAFKIDTGITSLTTKLAILRDSGNVGIGTTSPDSLLHVSADVTGANTGTITIEGRPTGFLGDDIATIDFHNNGSKRADIRMERGNAADDSQLVFSTSDTGTLNDALIINEIGNVGIGVTSVSTGVKLEVDGKIASESLRLKDSSATQYLNIGPYASQAYFYGYQSGNTIHFGQPATFVQNIQVQGTATATNFILSSDKTLKNNIKEIDTNHIDVDWKNFELKSEPGVKRAGVIAQELEEKHPEFVRTDDEGMKSVAYIDLLIAKIAELEARLEKAGI
mgnify:CR=1 FL=1